MRQVPPTDLRLNLWLSFRRDRYQGLGDSFNLKNSASWITKFMISKNENFFKAKIIFQKLRFHRLFDLIR